MTIREFITRFDNHERFDEEDLRDLYWGEFTDDDGYDEIDEEIEDKRRWSQFIHKYVQIGNRYFCLTADVGLTEYQDNSYDYQPIEVKPVEKLVPVITWEAI